MRSLRIYSIRAKLTLIILLTSAVAVLLACAIFFAYDQIQLREGMKRDLTILGEVIGNRSAVALQFDDRPLTEQNLAALRANKSIVAASIHKTDGKLFAGYRRDQADPVYPQTAYPDTRQVFEGGHLNVYVPIVVDGETVGMIFLHSDLIEIDARVRLLGVIFVVALGVSLCAALLLSSWLQQLLAVPIQHLINTAREISSRRDYSIRAKKYGEDELGVLVETFNDMLTQIQSRELALQQSENKYRGIYENASDGIFQTLSGGRLVTANPAMARILGYDSVDEIVAKFTDIHQHGYVDPEAVETLKSALLHGLRLNNFETAIRKKNGEPVFVSISARAVRDELGAVSHFEGSIVDITERKEKERTQRELQVADHANKAKSEFLANMSHEIRTPMNAIIGMTHLAMQSELSDKQRNYLEKVDTAAKGLLVIINDILDFSKIEAGKVVFENLDFHLEEVMENLADLSVIKAQDKGLELLFDIDADVPMALVGDPLRLGQVLVNLVNNAIKFTEQGEVRVSVRRLIDAQEGVLLRFAVSDTGVGLSEEERGRLFEAFTQADSSTTRKYGGTGLGLTICKRLVELIGGEIGVESQVGVGSTFHFTARFEVQAEQRPAHAASGGLQGLQVLVVDDNASAREIFQSMLVSLGFEAVTVASGAEALQELRRAQLAGKSFDLVLMDWHMPEADGVESIRQILAAPELHKPPMFMMVTAYSREELLKQLTARQIKIDGLLIKPVSSSVLCDSIMGAFGKEVPMRPRKRQRVSSKEAERSLQGAYILLVEDNAINRELAVEILENAGLNVDTAENGAQATAKVLQNHYDGVLMDCQMPVMDGFEATQKIRADGRFDDLPVIAMTANAMTGDRERCIAVGMNDHITKPIDVGQLFSTLAHWLKRSAIDEAALLQHPAVPLPVLAGVDGEGALARLGGDADLYRKLLGRFADDQPAMLDAIHAALAAGEVGDALRLTHTFKGLSGSIGADVLAASVVGLEQALEQPQSENSASLLAVVDSELAAVVAEIRRVQPAFSQSERPAEDLPSLSAIRATQDMPEMETLRPLLRDFMKLLAEDDLRALACFDAIEPLIQRTALEGDGRALRGALKRLAFDEALERMRDIASRLNVEPD